MAAAGITMDGAAGKTHQRASRPDKRRCLACRELFLSSGASERICSPCKGSEDWADAVAVTKGHIAW